MDTERLVTEAVKKYFAKLDIHVLKPAEITFTMLNFDEYDIALLMLELEDQFGVDLSEDNIAATATPGDMIELVTTYVHLNGIQQDVARIRRTPAAVEPRRFRGGQWERFARFRDEEMIYNEKYF